VDLEAAVATLAQPELLVLQDQQVMNTHKLTHPNKILFMPLYNKFSIFYF